MSTATREIDQSEVESPVELTPEELDRVGEGRIGSGGSGAPVGE